MRSMSGDAKSAVASNATAQFAYFLALFVCTVSIIG